MLQPREEFISKLLSLLKAQPYSNTASTTSPTEDFDSWEDRVDDEVSELFSLFIILYYSNFTPVCLQVANMKSICCCQKC